MAMLEGIRNNSIIVGAYSTRDGICPMIAAHRAGAGRGRTARRATERELLVLTAHLEASLLEASAPSSDLVAAIAEHRSLVARRGPRPGDPVRSGELRLRPGSSWTRVVRRYDDHERTVMTLDRQRSRVRASRDRQLVTPARG
jgi:hypothetical protein